MNKPKISVLTPLYNTKPKELRAMIESILNQTYGDFEFLLLNDSPENTEIENVIKSYDDARIKYMVNEYNMGISKSRNKLIDMAKGEYLAIVDHDDISVNTRFQKQADFLDTNPHIGVVGGNMLEIKNGTPVAKTKFPQHDHEIKLSLINEPYVCTPNHPTSMVRASVLRDNNIRYNEKWSPAEDHMLWIDLIDYTYFHNLNDVLLEYIWHDDNTTTRQWQKMYDLLPVMINDARIKYPIYYDEWRQKNTQKKYIGKISLFNFMPLLRIKHSKKHAKILLFNVLPIIKIKYNK